MIDYYAYFGVCKNATMHEVVDKLMLFLSRVREETAALKNDEERGEILSSALEMVQDLCRIFLVPREKAIYDKNLSEQQIISSKLYKIKSNVVPLNSICAKPKTFWLRLITNLIPHLEYEKQMMFLSEEDSIQDILMFIIEHNNQYTDLSISQNNTFIPLEIIKRSFDIAQSKQRKTVKVEDIVKSINDCEHLDKEGRSELAVMVFDRWYKTSNQVGGPTYKKTL